jgi:hypothetical protein
MRKRRPSGPTQQVAVIEMKTDLEELSFPTALTITAATVSTVFEIGYFSVVGLQFLSFVSLADWLIRAAVIVPVVASGYILIDTYGHRLRPKAIDKTTSLTLIVGLPALAFALLALASVWWKIEKADMIVDVVSIAAFSFMLWISWVRLQHAITRKKDVAARWLYLTLVLCMLVYPIARVNARSGSGQDCSVTTNGGRFEAEYLRFVGAGHLVRHDGKTIFVPNAEMKQISCVARDLDPQGRSVN